MKILLTELVTGPKFQNRCNLDQSVVDEYAEALRNGVVFPPVTVIFNSIAYFLADGYHRYFAHKAANLTEIDCEVINGTERDAVLYACGANALHGLKRSNADKRKAVMTMLKDYLWKSWSEREIANACKVTHTYVQNIRREIADLTGNVASEIPNLHGDYLKMNSNNQPETTDPNIRTYTNRYGKTATMNVANIGRKKKIQDEDEDDDDDGITITVRGFRDPSKDNDLLDMKNELLTILSAYTNVKSEKCREAVRKITNFLNTLNP